MPIDTVYTVLSYPLVITQEPDRVESVSKPVPSTPPPPPSAATKRPATKRPVLSTPPPPATKRPVLSPEDQRIYEEFRAKIGRKIPESRPNAEPIVLPSDCSPDYLSLMNKITLGNNHYIASAGWMDDEPALFWKLVDINRPGLIVKLKDKGVYWPNDGKSLSSSDSAMPKVTCIREVDINEKLTMRVIQVAGQNGVFNITHLDFKGWPDFGTPSIEQFKQLLEAANNECPENSPEKRIFVHCAGGMGRTGTFIAAHAALHTPIEQQTSDLFFNLIMDMRSQRPKPMVETPEQYLFLHNLIRQTSMPHA